MAPIVTWRYPIPAYHHFLATNLAACKSLTATEPVEKQKDQSQALLLEANQEEPHLLALYCNIP
jgi:hypothetical protein